MTLQDPQRDALVRHLAHRFPSWGVRADLARAAGLAEAQLTGASAAVWRGLVDEADRTGQLGALLAAAHRKRPDDPILKRLHHSHADGRLVVPAAEDPAAWVRNAAIASIVVLVLGVVALGLDLGLGRGSGATASDADGAAADAGTAAEGPEAMGTAEAPVEDTRPGAAATHAGEGGPGSTSPSGPSGDPPSGQAATSEDPIPSPGEPGTDAQQADDTADAGPAAPDRGPCPGSGVVGYAYAGRRAPAGDTWAPGRGLNVRADYPRRENRWNSRTRVVCVLPADATVRLFDPPIAVDGGAYWVPVHGGAAR